MSAGSDKVVALRRLLDERFPPAGRCDAQRLACGCPAVDAALGGGLETGTLTEFVSAGGAGSQLAVAALLHALRQARRRAALVDAADAFDLEAFDDDALAHLVWVRCATLDAAWRAADLAARDPNYAAVVVDVRGLDARALRRTRDGVWTRLQRAAEQAGTALLIQTDAPLVPNAIRRLVFAAALAPVALTTPRAELTAALEVRLQRERRRDRAGSA